MKDKEYKDLYRLALTFLAVSGIASLLGLGQDIYDLFITLGFSLAVATLIREFIDVIR